MGSVAGCTGLQRGAGTRPTSAFLPFRVHLRRSSRPPSQRSWPVATLSIPRPGAAVVRHARYARSCLDTPGLSPSDTPVGSTPGCSRAHGAACRAVPAFRAQRRTSTCPTGTSGTLNGDCAPLPCLPTVAECRADALTLLQV